MRRRGRRAPTADDPGQRGGPARFGIVGLKAALDMLGYYGGPVRSPLLDLTESERQALRDVLAEGGL